MKTRLNSKFHKTQSRAPSGIRTSIRNLPINRRTLKTCSRSKCLYNRNSSCRRTSSNSCSSSNSSSRSIIPLTSRTFSSSSTYRRITVATTKNRRTRNSSFQRTLKLESALAIRGSSKCPSIRLLSPLPVASSRKVGSLRLQVALPRPSQRSTYLIAVNSTMRALKVDRGLQRTVLQTTLQITTIIAGTGDSTLSTTTLLNSTLNQERRISFRKFRRSIKT